MKFRKNNILWILILVYGLSFGQTETKIKELIEKLNWETIPVTCNYTLVLEEFDSAANELVQIGKKANKQLLSEISNPEKSIGIHIILTRINDYVKYEKIGLGTKYIYKNCDDLIGLHHFYNGIVWEWFKAEGQTISESELKKLADYWNSKLNENQELTLSNSETIIKSLTEFDNEKYPCVDIRNHENNSEIIKIQELQSLLGRSNKSKEVNEMMNKLGNDSIHSYFKDSYFINYDTDGISFKFQKDSILYCVFIEQEYKGTFWNGIKLDDKKSIIEKKTVKPVKREKFGGEMENFWYTEPKFQIQFNSDNRIKYLMISK